MNAASSTDVPAWQALLARTLAERAATHHAADAAVVCLCAAWCGTCREFAAGFAQLAAEFPHATFRWLDIEEEADALGDADVETFPTLLIGGRDGAVRFAGPVLPQAAQIARLLHSLGL